MTCYEDLMYRGLIKDVASEDLQKLLDGEPISFYWGTDPTADSLHVGHYSSLITAKRLAKYGHHPILLVGGATGLIGDPRPTAEREIISKETLNKYYRIVVHERRRLPYRAHAHPRRESKTLGRNVGSSRRLEKFAYLRRRKAFREKRLHARAHRRYQRRHFFAKKENIHVPRRLFDDFEQRVLRLGGHLVGLLDHCHADRQGLCVWNVPRQSRRV